MSPLFLAPLLLIAEPSIPPAVTDQLASDLAELQAQIQQEATPQRQPTCLATFKELAEKLGEKYHEQPTSAGLTSAGEMLVVWATDTGETWTISVTAPTGKTCIVSAGNNWQNRPAKPAGEPS